MATASVSMEAMTSPPPAVLLSRATPQPPPPQARRTSSVIDSVITWITCASSTCWETTPSTAGYCASTTPGYVLLFVCVIVVVTRTRVCAAFMFLWTVLKLEASSHLSVAWTTAMTVQRARSCFCFSFPVFAMLLAAVPGMGPHFFDWTYNILRRLCFSCRFAGGQTQLLL